MTKISNIEIKQEPAHYTITVRKTIDFMKEYADFVLQVLSQSGAYLNELGVHPIDGPMVCFHNQVLETLDVEIGWTIAQKIEDRADMHCGLIPTRKIITAIDLGPYEEQDATLMDIFAYIKDNNCEPQGPIYYNYLNDTERPITDYLTKMYIPVK